MLNQIFVNNYPIFCFLVDEVPRAFPSNVEAKLIFKESPMQLRSILERSPSARLKARHNVLDFLRKMKLSEHLGQTIIF